MYNYSMCFLCVDGRFLQICHIYFIIIMPAMKHAAMHENAALDTYIFVKK